MSAIKPLPNHPTTSALSLTDFGVNAEDLEMNDKLRIYDWYTGTFGQKSKEKWAQDLLRVADLSIWFAKLARRKFSEPLTPILNTALEHPYICYQKTERVS